MIMTIPYLFSWLFLMECDQSREVTPTFWVSGLKTKSLAINVKMIAHLGIGGNPAC